MKTLTRSREYREGWIGRRRNYKCRNCGEKFQVDTAKPLSEKLRVCPECKEREVRRSDCPICGNSFPHREGYIPKTCGTCKCLKEADKRGLL